MCATDYGGQAPLWDLHYLVCFRHFFDNIAKVNVGVAYPLILALTLAVAILVIKILVMDIERSRNAIRMQRLIQRLGLLESDIREMQGKAREGDHNTEHGELDDISQLNPPVTQTQKTETQSNQWTY